MPSQQPYRFRPVLPSDAKSLQDTCMRERSLQEVANLLARTQKAALNRRGLGLVVALPNNRLIGFGQLTLWPRQSEISDLVVAEAWRGQGIGTQIIQRLIRAAVDLAVERVEIGVSQHNPAALRLYHRLGFADDRTIQIDLGDGPEQVLYLSKPTNS